MLYEAALCLTPKQVTRESIERLEQYTAHQPQVEIPVTHVHAQGLYGREICVPAGTLMTGKVHKQEHISILLEGSMTAWTEEGMKFVEGPCVWITPAGVKRVGMAHTDVRWLTVHATETRDVERLELELWEQWALPAPEVKEIE